MQALLWVAVVHIPPYDARGPLEDAGLVSVPRQHPVLGIHDRELDGKRLEQGFQYLGIQLSYHFSYLLK
jgi:hypothetical protein